MMRARRDLILLFVLGWWQGRNCRWPQGFSFVVAGLRSGQANRGIQPPAPGL